jgi:maltose alpha-D-glucosyltransferase/alpha-amylase
MGDNIFLGDRNGVRTPMQWSSDKNAGFSRTTPQALYAPIILDPEYHYESVNVENQLRNQHSLLWWTKRLLALRKRWKVFGLGTLEFLHPENRKVLAFIRRWENETVLIVCNLSRFPQPVELDLARFQDHVPIELFGRTEFPAIRAAAYPLTISPHSAFWFSLEPAAARRQADVSMRGKTLVATEEWEEFVTGKGRGDLEACLPAYLQQRRWFTDKGEIKSARLRDLIPLPLDAEKVFVATLIVDYAQSEPEEYLLPLAFASGAEAERIQHEAPHFIVARGRVTKPGVEGVLYDAAAGKAFGKMLFEVIARRRTVKAARGSLNGYPASVPRAARVGEVPEPSATKTEQRNTAIIYGDKYILKLFRRIEAGVHPGREAAQFLADRNFPRVPPFAGSLEFQSDDGERTCVGLLHGYIANATDGWQFTLDALRRYFDRVRTLPTEARDDGSADASLIDLAEHGVSDPAAEIIGTYFETARLLGQRTGELHVALAADPDNKDFAPEPFTPFYQRSLYQSLRNHLALHFRFLKRELKRLPESVRPLAEKVLGLQDAILARYRAVHQTPMAAMRIRCHGNFHLGHALHTGKDFFIIDFEGEPAWSLSERRIKRSPLRDVAGMIRSLHYAAHVALLHQVETGNLHAEQVRALKPWAHFWERRVSADFLKAYLTATASSRLLPQTKPGLAVLLEAFLLDQAIIELNRELPRRNEGLRVPLQGILQIVGPTDTP